MKIAVVYSLPTQREKDSPYIETEEDTKESAEEVASALSSKGATVEVLSISENTLDTIQSVRADLIFNLIEWTGLDLPLAVDAFGRIEATHIPYTGATAAQYNITTDKIALKKLLDTFSLPTAPWQEFITGQEAISSDFPYPALVKPGSEHCSIGITKNSIVHDEAHLRRVVAHHIHTFKQPVYAEEFLTGSELQVTLYEEKHGLVMLPPAEIIYDEANSLNLLSYESRWDEENPEFKHSHVRLATLPPARMEELERIGKKTFTDLQFRDYSRLDIRLKGQQIYILEANSNPGLGDSDDYGMTVSYKAAGMTFTDFVWKIVESAIRRG